MDISFLGGHHSTQILMEMTHPRGKNQGHKREAEAGATPLQNTIFLSHISLHVQCETSDEAWVSPSSGKIVPHAAFRVPSSLLFGRPFGLKPSCCFYLLLAVIQVAVQLPVVSFAWPACG